MHSQPTERLEGFHDGPALWLVLFYLTDRHAPLSVSHDCFYFLGLSLTDLYIYPLHSLAGV